MGQCAPVTRPRRQKRLSQSPLLPSRASQEHSLLKSPRSSSPSPAQYKFLILGCGIGGKSVIFKRLAHYYGEGHSWTPTELTETLQYNLTQAMATLAMYSKSLQEAPRFNTGVHPSIENIRKRIENLGSGVGSKHVLTKEDVKQFHLLLKDNGIKNTLKILKSPPKKLPWRVYFPSDFEYIVSRMDEYVDPHFVPTVRDAISVREGSAFEETQLSKLSSIPCIQLETYAGQREERKNWIYGLKKMPESDLICFVVDIGQFDYKLRDGRQNNVKLLESLQVFSELVNSRWVKHVRFCIFFTLFDLFMDRIEARTATLKSVFDDYPGPDGNVDAALEFLKRKFRDACDHPNKIIGMYPMYCIGPDLTFMYRGDHACRLRRRQNLIRGFCSSFAANLRHYDLHEIFDMIDSFYWRGDDVLEAFENVVEQLEYCDLNFDESSQLLNPMFA